MHLIPLQLLGTVSSSWPCGRMVVSRLLYVEKASYPCRAWRYRLCFFFFAVGRAVLSRSFIHPFSFPVVYSIPALSILLSTLQLVPHPRPFTLWHGLLALRRVTGASFRYHHAARFVCGRSLHRTVFFVYLYVIAATSHPPIC